MKLYFRPGSLSLAVRMILLESGITFEEEPLDIFGQRTASGADYLTISPHGDVPALVIADGLILTQPSAILQHCADLSGLAGFAPAPGSLQRARLYEAIGVVSDLHHALALVSQPLIDDDQGDNIMLVTLSRKALVAKVNRSLWRLDALLPERGHWLGEYSPADIYLFCVLQWIPGLNSDLTEPIAIASFPRIQALMDRIASRSAIRAALQSEGLV